MLSTTQREELANILFPDVKDSEEYIKQYPKRDLPKGVEVTRFAPSPTGFVHMGSIYTALISSKLAHQTNGIFILRIEDTDKTREIKNGVEQIVESLNKYNLIPDEGIFPNKKSKGHYGPYMQSRRLDIYKAFAKKLVIEGKAYPCFMTLEELKTVREEQERLGIRIGYYGKYAKWRDADMMSITKALSEGKNFVIRLKSNGNFNKKFIFKDIIKGSFSFPENDFDSILLKSDGYPVYHFAHSIDDHLMDITTVIRGDEWLSSIPLHKELFDTFGWKIPQYAHISPLMKIDENTKTKRKLSKRKDPEANASYYIERGYPVEGIMEYLLNIANSGFYDWRIQNPNKKVEEFILKLEKIHKSGALFDLIKLENICKNLIAKYTAEEVYNMALNWSKDFDKDIYKKLSKNRDYCISILNIERRGEKIRKDIAKLEDLREQLEIFFDDTFNRLEYPTLKEGYKEILKKYLEIFNINDDKVTWFNKIKEIAREFNYAIDTNEYIENPNKYNGSIGDIAMIIRIALTKKTKTPDLYQIIQVLGDNKVRDRIKSCISL